MTELTVIFGLLQRLTCHAETLAPLARCNDVSLELGLGILHVGKTASQSVRLLVTLLPTDEDEVTAMPDSATMGLRISRKVRCGLHAQDTTAGIFNTAGIAASVQWVMPAPVNATFLATVQARGAVASLSVLAYEDTSPIGVYVCKILLENS